MKKPTKKKMGTQKPGVADKRAAKDSKKKGEHPYTAKYRK